MNRRNFTKAALIGSLAAIVGVPALSKVKRFKLLDTVNVKSIDFNEYTGDYNVTPADVDKFWKFAYKRLYDTKYNEGIWYVGGNGNSTGSEIQWTTIQMEIEFSVEDYHTLHKATNRG